MQVTKTLEGYKKREPEGEDPAIKKKKE